jgi:dCTP diphosphatase
LVFKFYFDNQNLIFKSTGEAMEIDKNTTVQDLKNIVEKVISDRDWGQFHNAKNLSMAIATEAAELMEHFLWLSEKESSEAMSGKDKEEIEHEVVDVAWMLLCLCNSYDIDLTTAFKRKLEINQKKYPVEKAKGRREKYTEL